jgi:tetratricopeptide (TPR) repeat protein
MYERFGQAPRARLYYDSAATYMEATVKRHPERPSASGLLALAYAGLDRKDEAVRAAEQAARMLDETTDALDGPEWVANVALVYAMVGNSVKALEWLERAMATPSRLSPKWIELDPAWTPLRGEPRFKKLIRQPPALRTVVTRVR